MLSINDETWLEGQFLSEDEPSAESLLILKENFKSFHSVWDELDEKAKYLLSERYLFDKSAKEIADDILTTPENVRMMLTRTRRKVQKMLEKEHV